MTSPAVGVATARLVEVLSLPFRDRYFASLSLIGRRAAAMGLSKTTAGARFSLKFTDVVFTFCC
jgi:hypothetical protein